ncbi:MAG TPA: glutathione transferase GstA [Candidatus Binataceae bacterium]|nr:glutathione transferase GstA [Candidatus Binataceae bacterium]
MKLFLTPGACSLSPHIALREAGLPFDFEQVDLKTKQTKSGADYRKVNPKGSVPALQLDNGQVLTEGPAIVQYIADQKPASKLAPAAGSFERSRLQEWLNYNCSELHKLFGPLFNPATPEDQKQATKAAIGAKFDFVNRSLEGKQFLLGDTFSVADGYLFVILTWSKHVGIDLSRWPALNSFFDRVVGRPAVQAAMKAEGLIQ